MSSGAEPALARCLERRRDLAAAAWDLHDGVVVIEAGEELPVPGRGDRAYPFRSHAEYLWLTDRERPRGALAFDPDRGWAEFVDPVTESELLWTGIEGDRVGVPEGTRPLEELAAFLAGREPRRLGATSDPDAELRDALIRARRPKDEVEVGRMRAAAEATRAGFARLASLVEPGRTERELQVEIEAEFLRAGGDFLSFETIVAAGPHAAVLHFMPTDRELRDGELLLVDAGAEVRGYAGDVTRTYFASGEPVGEQAVAYAAVRRALEAGVACCAPGVSWRDVHVAAALAIADGLVELGVLRGERESLVESGAVSLFFPHGVGHLVGLGVRDAGMASDERRDPPPGLPQLRADLELEVGHGWTVEPGIYFVPALLDRERGHADVDWERADALAGFGGVRLEHDVLIGEGGCEVLTEAIPL